MTLKLGALPPVAKPRVRLNAFLTSEEPSRAAQQASSVDYLSRVTEWGVLGNDEYGDCAWAGMAHLLMANAAYTAAGAVSFTTDGVLKAYAEATGFDPKDPSTDQGTVLQDALNFMVKHGMVDADGKVHKILAFAQVNVADANEVDRAHQLFGATYNGFSVYRFAMDEFRAGRPWTEHVYNRGPLEGGHCVPTMKTNVSSESRTSVTWGKPQMIGRKFWEHYFSEAWVAITPEWVDLAGKSPSGLDLQGLLDEVKRLQDA